MPALSHGPIEIILQLRAVIRVGAIGDDPLCPFARRQIADIGKAMLCNQYVHIVLRMVDMGSERHDTGDPAVLGSRFGDKNGQLRIAPEVA